MEFDAFELCSSELQNKLVPMREKFKEYEDTLVEESSDAKTKDKGDSAKKEMKKEPFWFKDGKRIKKAIITHFPEILYIELGILCIL